MRELLNVELEFVGGSEGDNNFNFDDILKQITSLFDGLSLDSIVKGLSSIVDNFGGTIKDLFDNLTGNNSNNNSNSGGSTILPLIPNDIATGIINGLKK